MKEYVRRVKATVEDSWLDPHEEEEVAKADAAEAEADAQMATDPPAAAASSS